MLSLFFGLKIDCIDRTTESKDMATQVLPTMSSSGWVQSPSEKANRLFAYYYTSMKSQTALYGRSVTSLQWSIQQAGGNMIALKNDLTDSINGLLRSYFEYAETDIQIDELEPDTGKMLVRLYATVRQDGVNYSFGKLIVQEEGILKPILDMNNEGI